MGGFSLLPRVFLLTAALVRLLTIARFFSLPDVLAILLLPTLFQYRFVELCFHRVNFFQFPLALSLSKASSSKRILFSTLVNSRASLPASDDIPAPPVDTTLVCRSHWYIRVSMSVACQHPLMTWRQDPEERKSKEKFQS